MVINVIRKKKNEFGVLEVEYDKEKKEGGYIAQYLVTPFFLKKNINSDC